MTARLLNAGLQIQDGTFSYLWFEIEENGLNFFRVAALRELAAITLNPQQEKEGMLARQWGALIGLYNAGVNFVYTACGQFSPNYVGITQLYGAAANGRSEAEAAGKAIDSLRAVQGTLANYPQSRLKVPDLDIMRWYVEFLAAPQHFRMVIGHPDPRARKRGLGLEGRLPDDSADDLAMEQNEILFRGFAAARENFVYQVVADHISRTQIIDNLAVLARISGDYASRVNGAVTASISAGLPIIASSQLGYSGSISEGQSVVNSEADGASRGWGQTHTESESHTDSTSVTQGHAESWGETGILTRSNSHTTSDSQSTSTSETVSESSTHGSSVSNAEGSSWSRTRSAALNQGENLSGGASFLRLGGSAAVTQTEGVSWGGSNTHVEVTSQSSTSGRASTVGSGETHGIADTIGSSESTGWSHSVTNSVSGTVGRADTVGTAEGLSQNWGESHTQGLATGRSLGRTGGQSLGSGLSGGFSPALGLSRSWQTVDDLAARAAETLRGVQGLFNAAANEGGFMTDVLLATATASGATLAEALAPQAFYGQASPRPVQAVDPLEPDRSVVLDCVRAFLTYNGSPRPEDPLDNLAWTPFGTFMRSEQVAGLTAPSLLQDGTANVIAPIPDGFGFYPKMPGELILGHQYSPSTAELTNTPVCLDRKRLMHTAFAGNTGFGKSVAAMRLTREMAYHWDMRVVVLDFGFAWRMLLNAPGIGHKVDIRQLRPDGMRPLRWNPLQISRYIHPETQMRAFVDIFGSVAQLGQKQQQHRLQDALREVYTLHGVLVDDPLVRRNPQWNQVCADDHLDGVPLGTPLGMLSIQQRQELAVERSRKVDLNVLRAHIEEMLVELNRDNRGRKNDIAVNLYEGILWRLQNLTTGAAAAQFAGDTPGNRAIAVEELGRPSGVVVLEGGKFLDQFSKAWLLGWAGWLIYADMVARREQQIATGEADLFMVFEEANIILTGLDGSDPENRGAPNVAEQYTNMFRDSRKYGAFFGVVTQSPALIPPGILSSCNNLVAGYLTHPKDKDVVLSALPRSEKGFHDEPWRRFLSDLPIGMCLGRFPYDSSREFQLPFVWRPLLLEAPEPTDEEIANQLGRIIL